MNCQARNARDRQQRRQALLQNQPPALNTNTVNAIYPIGRASLPLAFIDQQAYWRPLELGTMNVLCPSCEAKHWINERSPPSSKTAPRFESCCKKGDVALSKLSTPPDVLRALVSEDTVEGNIFAKTFESSTVHCHLPLSNIHQIPELLFLVREYNVSKFTANYTIFKVQLNPVMAVNLNLHNYFSTIPSMPLEFDTKRGQSS